MPLALLQKLCFNKKLCQIFLILIREYKQLSLNVCVLGEGGFPWSTQMLTLNKSILLFSEEDVSAWSDFSSTKGFSFIFEFPQLPSQRANRPFVWYVIPLQWDITYCRSTHHRLFLSFFCVWGVLVHLSSNESAWLFSIRSGKQKILFFFSLSNIYEYTKKLS